MDKFLGRPKSQRVAAVLEEHALETDLSEESQEGGDDAGTSPTARTTLTQLLAQQSALTERIAAWNEEDF